jgi:hypothetical protein
MAYDIRPLSFAEVFDRTFRILVDNARVLIAITAIYFIPKDLLSPSGPPAGAGRPLVMFWLMAAATGAIWPLYHAALTSAVADIYLDRPVTLGKSYKSAWELYWPFFGTYLLFGIIVGACAFVVGIFFAIPLTYAGGPAGALVGISLTYLVLVPIMAQLCLIAPIMVVEDTFGGSALSRSMNLVKGAFWPTFGLVLLNSLLIGLPEQILNRIWSSIPIVGSALTAIGDSLVVTFAAIAIVVYYIDRRCRLEDFDLHRLAEQVGQSRSLPVSAEQASLAGDG